MTATRSVSSSGIAHFDAPTRAATPTLIRTPTGGQPQLASTRATILQVGERWRDETAGARIVRRTAAAMAPAERRPSSRTLADTSVHNMRRIITSTGTPSTGATIRPLTPIAPLARRQLVYDRMLFFCTDDQSLSFQSISH